MDKNIVYMFSSDFKCIINFILIISVLHFSIENNTCQSRKTCRLGIYQNRAPKMSKKYASNQFYCLRCCVLQMSRFNEPTPFLSQFISNFWCNELATKHFYSIGLIQNAYFAQLTKLLNEIECLDLIILQKRPIFVFKNNQNIHPT